MYIPKHFLETDSLRIRRTISENNFGVLISIQDDAPFATHLPFLYDPEEGEHGTLRGHIARQNPHSGLFDSVALAIFSGPHAYISPNDYVDYGVPTWNYEVVHCYGVPRRIDDPGATFDIIKRLTAQHESALETPWTPDERAERMLGALIGFEMPITRIEAKSKLSQNRSEEDREKAIARLATSEYQTERELAVRMTNNTDR